MPESPDAARPAGESPHRRTAGAVVSTWVRLIVTTLVGVGQAPILFRNVPPAELGVWYLFFALATFISISDLGLATAFARAVSYRWGPERPRENVLVAEIPSIYRDLSLPELYRSVLVATAIFGVGLAVLAIPAALVYFAHAIPAALQATLVVPLVVFLAGVVSNITASIPGACLSGRGDVALDNAVRAAASVFGFGLICILVPIYKSLGVLCAIYVVQGTAAFVASHVIVTRRQRLGRLHEVRSNFPLIRAMYRESSSIFVTRLGLWLTLESTLLIGAYFLGPQRIADFGLLRQIVAIGGSIVSAIPLAVSPNVAAAHAAGDREKVRNLYLASLRYALIVNVLWAVGLLLWSPTVMDLLVGEGHFLGYGVLIPLTLATFLELHGVPHAYFAWNVGKWILAPWVVAGGVLNVVFASLACPFFGFEGLAWGSMAAQAVTVHWIEVAYALRLFAVALRTYLKDVILPAVAYATALGASGAGLKWCFVTLISSPAVQPGGAVRAAYALAAIAATTTLAAILAWLFILTTGDRAYFRRLLRIRR